MTRPTRAEFIQRWRAAQSASDWERAESEALANAIYGTDDKPSARFKVGDRVACFGESRGGTVRAVPTADTCLVQFDGSPSTYFVVDEHLTPLRENVPIVNRDVKPANGVAADREAEQRHDAVVMQRNAARRLLDEACTERDEALAKVRELEKRLNDIRARAVTEAYEKSR